MDTEQQLKINTLEVMMQENSKEHDEIKKSIVSFSKKLDDSLEKMESKFAGKWVEKVMWSAGGIIGTIILIAIISEVIK